MKRTSIDFSKHRLTAKRDAYVHKYELSLPSGSPTDKVVFVNVVGCGMAVFGDHDNWVFCREFDPLYMTKCDDAYMTEKMITRSTQSKNSSFDVVLDAFDEVCRRIGKK